MVWVGVLVSILLALMLLLRSPGRGCSPSRP
jgi:hypothetical protein